jgi:O-antigen ligase
MATLSILVAMTNLKNRSVAILPLRFPILIYLVTTGISIFSSYDVGRSIQLSLPLLPAVLLFFLIAGYFNGTKDIRLLFFTFSLVALGISSVLLWAVCMNKGMNPSTWVTGVGSTILVVKNDVTFLAVLAPFSLALLYREPRRLYGIVAVLSVLLSIAVVGIFQSRGAMLTMVASITCFFILIRPKIGLTCGLATIVFVLLVDGFMGFPLVERFGQHWDGGSGRIPLWLSAWEMFLDAPLLGHGPHTFVLFYNSYLQNLSLPSWLSVDPRIVPWPHNLYLEVLAEQGIVGIISLGLLLSCGISAAWNLRRAPFKDVQIFGYGAFAGIAGFCIAASFELTFLRQWVVLIMFTLLGAIAQLSTLEKK